MSSSMKKKASHFNITACCEKNTVGDPDTGHSPLLLLATNCSRRPFWHKPHEAMASSLGDKLRLILQKNRPRQQLTGMGHHPSADLVSSSPGSQPTKSPLGSPKVTQVTPSGPGTRPRPQSETNPSPKGPTLRAHTLSPRPTLSLRAHAKAKVPREA